MLINCAFLKELLKTQSTGQTTLQHSLSHCRQVVCYTSLTTQKIQLRKYRVYQNFLTRLVSNEADKSCHFVKYLITFS